MSIRTRIIGGTIVELLIFLLIILGIVVSTGKADRSDDQVRLTLRRLSQAQVVEKGAAEEMGRANDLKASGGTSYEATDYNREVQRGFIAWEKSLLEAIDISGDSSLGLRQKNLLARVEALRKTYSTIAGRVDTAATASNAGRAAEAVELASAAEDLYENTFQPGLDAVIESEQANAAAADRQSRDATSRARNVTLVFAPAGLLIIAIIAFFFTREIATSFKALKEGAARFGSGDLDARIDIGSDDEFNEVASEFNRMAAELQRTTQELRQYDHTVSHDIKGPLASASLASGLLVEELAPKELRTSEGMPLSELADIIRRNIGNATVLIDELLLLAEAGQVPSEVEDVVVSEVVARSLSEHRPEIERKRIDVRVEEDLGTVRANPAQIYQLFSNLISNAVKHSAPSEPTFEIAYLGTAGDGAHSYRIRDNSAGIDPALLEHVFEPFTKGERGGTGLGLATVRKIVSVYGGAVTARNDGGAVIEFTLKDWNEGPEDGRCPPDASRR